jgi:hypothetical protein
MPNGRNNGILSVDDERLKARMAGVDEGFVNGPVRLCVTGCALQLHKRVKTGHLASFEAVRCPCRCMGRMTVWRSGSNRDRDRWKVFCDGMRTAVERNIPSPSQTG